jgi:DNA-binding response OmpR family regulator
VTPTILVVDDDQALAEMITIMLRGEGFDTHHAEDGPVALEQLEAVNPDVVLLDVMLPGMDGMDVCAKIRETSGVPIIMLTAKGEEEDKVRGLELGADDYVTKPFSIRELLARAEAVLRRSVKPASPGPVDALRFGSFHLDQDSRKLRDDKKGWVKLSPKEYQLLAFFLERRGQALSRDQIMSGVWGHDSRVTSRSIDRFVTQLRKVIETEQGQWIETIREYGYRFRPESGGK